MEFCTTNLIEIAFSINTKETLKLCSITWLVLVFYLTLELLRNLCFSERTILCVRGIADHTTEDSLKKSFDGCVDAYIVKDDQTGRKR